MTGAEFHGVDIDLLADYVGGALDGTPEADRVAALIADDPAWREAFELLAPEMATVGALLGGLPAEPMPDDVAARLELALGALPLGGVAADAVPEKSSEPALSGADAVPHIVVDLDERRRKRGNNRWVRMAAPIGIAAGVAGVVGYGLFGHSASMSDSGESKATGEQAPAVMVDAAPAMLASGINYTLGTLGQAAISATGGEASKAPRDQANVSDLNADALQRLRAPQALLDCLDAIARENGGGQVTPSSVDYARFDGKPAVVIRFTAENGEWAWASGADCGLRGGGADTLGAVPVR